MQLTVTEPTPVDEATPSQTQQKRELLRKAGAEVELRAQADPTSGQLRSELPPRHPRRRPIPWTREPCYPARPAPRCRWWYWSRFAASTPF